MMSDTGLDNATHTGGVNSDSESKCMVIASSQRDYSCPVSWVKEESGQGPMRAVSSLPDTPLTERPAGAASE